jgi:hypothetical protein
VALLSKQQEKIEQARKSLMAYAIGWLAALQRRRRPDLLLRRRPFPPPAPRPAATPRPYDDWFPDADADCKRTWKFPAENQAPVLVGE